jgi:MoaA/NifB/PqqE/SkfB family radical SAM enzyme
MRLSERLGTVFWKPNSVSIDITNRCACRCKQCDIWRSESREELDGQVVKDVVDDLGKWLGSYGLTIGGGEPMMRKDIMDLCAYAIQNGATVNLLTNGMHFNENTVRKICEIGIQRLAVSVDGLADNHDYLRGIPNLFSRVEEALATFRRQPSRPTIVVETIVTKQNLGELEQLLQWVESLEVSGLLLHPLAPNFGSDHKDPAWHEKSEFWIKDHSLLDETIGRLVSLKNAGRRIINAPSQLESIKRYYRDPMVPASKGRKCNAGKSSVMVDCRGDVIFCYPFGAVGNVMKDPVSKLWYSKEAAQMRQRIRSCQRNCSLLNCYFGGTLLEKAYRYLRYH